MPFEKGHSHLHGRPKGSSNKSTEIVKRSVALNTRESTSRLYRMT